MRCFAAALLLGNCALAQTTFNFTTFDAPGSVETHVSGLDDHGRITGYYITAPGGNYASYVRTPSGSFSSPIQVRGDSTDFTGINNTSEIVGYFNNAGANTGLILAGGKLSTYLFPGATATQIFGVNKNGDFAGQYTQGSFIPGFLHLNATNTDITITVPGMAYVLNAVPNDTGYVVGSYVDSSNTIVSSFLRNPAGTITIFSYPAALITEASSINTCGVMVGTWSQATSGTPLHGFYGKFGKLKQLDVPGATGTVAVSVNNQGTIAGSYYDALNVRHGFVATPTVPSCTI